MNRAFRLSLVASLLLLGTAAVWQEKPAGGTALITQLLDQPAPPPPPLPVVAQSLAQQRKAWEKRRTALDTKPDADAPPKAVLDYWDYQVQFETHLAATEQERWQLLAACTSGTGFYYRTLQYLPDTPAAHERIKTFLAEADSPQLTEQAAAIRKEAKDSLRVWLRRHSRYFRDELLLSVKQGGERGWDDLAALAKLDWEQAAPFVEQQLGQADPFPRTQAMRLRYLHALATQSAQTEEWRWQLRTLVTDRQTPREARRVAFEALVEADWPGLEDWFAALFAEDNLLRGKSLLSDDDLARPVKAEPAKWNPLLGKLVASSNRTIHENAVLCLATVALRKPNREALLPLLPWLSDPKWTTAGDEYTRYRVIEGAGALQLSEALPGLLAIVRNEKEYVRGEAVEALAKYRAPESVARITQALREAIRQEPADYSLAEMTKLLAALGGFSDAEKLAALEALAAEASFSFSDDYNGRRLRVNRDEVKTRQASIGLLVLEQAATDSPFFMPGEGTGKPIESWQGPFTASVAAGLLERSRALRLQQPLVAQRLWLIAECLEFPVVDVALAEQLATGQADLDTLLIVLQRRTGLAAHAEGTLTALLPKGGALAGFSAVLLDNSTAQQAILAGKDRLAQAALLAAARMVREPSPLDLIGSLYRQKEPLLRLAAERYLESEDSPAARQLIHAQHPGEALILGARANFDPKPKYGPEWNQWEDALREDVKQDRATEILGAISMHTSDTGSPTYSFLEVRVRGENAELCRRADKTRQACRALTAGEWLALRGLLTEVNFDELPPLDLPGSGFGGTYQEFVRLSKSGGRRVYAGNLSFLRYRNDFAPAALTPYEKLLAAWDLLEKSGTFEVRYALKEKIKDLEVLAVDDAHPIKNVCGQGGEIRVLVENTARRYQEQPQWHVWLPANQLGAATTQPDACPVVDDKGEMPEKMREIRLGFDLPLWQIRTKDGSVRQRTWNEEYGLWLCRNGQDPKLLLSSYIHRWQVSPDGRWVLVDNSTREKTEYWQIELPSGKTTEVKLAGVGSLLTVEPASGRFLFAATAQSSQQSSQQYGLYDPATGKLDFVKGEFAPLLQQYGRPLQPVVGAAQEFWAALPDEKNKTTRVGRYDTKRFQFKALLELPEISFTSNQMWIDEKARQLYLAYNGHLLRLPFPK